jgi:hypothetical protein
VHMKNAWSIVLLLALVAFAYLQFTGKLGGR